MRRDTLLPLLWPDLDQARARHALRNTLHSVRKALGRGSVRNRGKEEIVLERHALWFDAAAFDEAVAEGRDDDAIALYVGDFLPGFHVPDAAPELDQWLDGERDRLARGYERALERVAANRDELGRHHEAADAWRALVRRSPFRNRFVARLMRSLAAGGDREAAVRAAEVYVEQVRQELDVDPDPGVVALATQLRSHEGEVQPGARTVTAPVVQAGNAPPPRAAVPPRGRATTGSPAPVAEMALVGRREELRRLEAAWTAAATERRTGFVAITGVPGIGKTRLAEEHLTRVARGGFAHARSRCYAAEGRLAWGPVAGWLRAAGLRAGLRSMEPVWLTEVARVMPELLAEHPGLPKPEPLSESWQRRRLFEALARATLAAAPPIALLIDDLQWCDSETFDWLRFMMRFAPSAGLLVIGTLRDEEAGPEHPWNRLRLALLESGQLTEIPLRPLDRARTGDLAAEAAERALTSEQTDLVFKESEGNPLFVLEAVRAGLLATGISARTAAPASEPWLPPRIQAVIEMRFAQLSSIALDVLALAATIGRPFTIEILAEAGAGDADVLTQAVDELWRRRILSAHGLATWDFSHDKLREAAYAAIGPARRRLLHRRAALALEAVSPPQAAAISSRLAAHYEQGGLPEEAIAHYERAAEAARRASGDEEVIRLLTRALTLLADLPDGRARDESELRMVTVLGASAIAARGWAARAAGDAFARAVELVRRMPEVPPEIVNAVWGLHAFHMVRGDQKTALAVTEPLWALACASGIPHADLAMRFNLAFSHFHCGELTDAARLLEFLASDDTGRSWGPFAGFPLGVLTLSYRSHVLWHLGDTDGALACTRDALALAEGRADPFGHALALAYEAMLHQFRFEPAATRAAAVAAGAICEQHGIAYYQAWAAILRGWADGVEGEPRKGIHQIERGLADLLDTGAELRRPYYLGLLADLHARSGDVRRARELLAEALAIAVDKGERWCEPELLRLEGELLRSRGSAAEAESRFLEAAALARRQGARAVEARATACLQRGGGQGPADHHAGPARSSA